MREEVLQFLKQKNPQLCVIATATPHGKPEAAVMGYAVRDNLILYLSTQKTTRKYNNLKENSHVSLVIGWAFAENNVQIDGKSRIIEQGDEYQKTEQFFFAQNEGAKAFKNSDTVFIEIKPVWIRFMNRTVEPAKITEEIVS